MVSLLRVLAILSCLIGGSDVIALPMSRAMTLRILPQMSLLSWAPFLWGIFAFVIADLLMKGRPYWGLICGWLMACLPLVGFCEYLDRSISFIEVEKRLSEAEWNQLRAKTQIAVTSEWTSKGERIIFERGEDRRKSLIDALSSLQIAVSPQPPEPVS